MRILFFSLLLIFTCCCSCFAKTEVSVLIYNGSVLTVSDGGIIDRGVVAVNDDVIVEVGGSSLLERYDAPLRIDAAGKIVMPGFINTHTHIPMAGFRGLGENGIRDRLFGFFFPLEKKFINEDFVYLASIHACIEMIMGGVTTFCDMYYFMEKEAEAAKKIGMRGVLGETIIDYPAPDAPNPDVAIMQAIHFIESYSKDELITPGFAPHSPYTLADNYLRKVSDLALKYNAPVITHMAEIPKEENKKFDLDNIYHLQHVGLLRNRLTIAHAIHIDEKQMHIIRDNNVGVAYNPMANVKGATGIANACEMMKLGIKTGLGTDGPMSSNELTLFRVMSYAANLQRLLHRNRTVMTPPEVVRMATLGGAEALHIDRVTGSLETGKKADIIIVDLSAPNMVPHHDLYAALVYQAEPSNVDTVVINGRIILQGRKLLTYSMEQDAEDMAKISAAVSAYGKILQQKARDSQDTK